MSRTTGNADAGDAVTRVGPLARYRTRAGLIFAALVAALLMGAPAALATSRAISSTWPMYEGVHYGPGEAEYMNVYPSATAGSPVVVFVHGGGWRTMNWLSKFEDEARSLQGQGISTFVIDYPGDSRERPAFPLEPNAVIAATRWVRAHAASYNGDASKLVLVGGSAGGNLVALAGEELAASEPGVVKGVVSLSGPMNLVTIAQAMEGDTITNESFETSVHRALGWPVGGAFPEAFAEEWSPALHVPTANCPAWQIYNSEEEFIPASQATEMYDDLVNAGCKATLRLVPGSEHAFMYWHTVKPQIFSFVHGI